MWCDSVNEVLEAERFIKFIIQRENFANTREDMECLSQETLVRLLDATQKDAQQDVEELDIEKANRLSESIKFDRNVQRYTVKIIRSAFFDSNLKVNFRKKTAKELDNAPDGEENKTVQLFHTSVVSSGTKQGEDIYEQLPTDSVSPQEEIHLRKTATKFVDILKAQIESEKSEDKRRLFYAFFSMEFRCSNMTQKELGERYGFKGNVAVTMISRFISKLSDAVVQHGLELEISDLNGAHFEAYFLHQSYQGSRGLIS